MARWLPILMALGLCYPMWAKLLNEPEGDPLNSSIMTDDGDEASDVLPEPTPEKPAPPPPVPKKVEEEPLPSKPTLTAEFSGFWQPPDYSNQEKRLGYGPQAFAIPGGMEARVQFWIDIYTKYNNDQGILHDSRYLSVIYETVELSDLRNDQNLSAYQKDKAIAARIKSAKHVIAERLKSLQDVKDPSSLTGEDLRYWKMFEKIDEPNKFLDASRKGRLRFQAGQRDQFIRGIGYAGRYLKQIEAIFADEGLPIELTRLPFVESSYNIYARSKVGASGIWQFMRATARLNGLRINDTVDERNDPLLASRSAARKLKKDFEMLQTWPLTITGWNRGAAGVDRLTRSLNTRDIAELTDVRHGRFGFASANFFASFLAALIVEKDAEKYFSRIPVMQELKGDEFRLDKPLELAKVLEWFGGDETTAKLYNPHIKLASWKKGHLQKKDLVRLPHELASRMSGFTEPVDE